jgi:DNA (cytosine-5)-methyltransferase 1
MSTLRKLTYISLFSAAGIGCFGFKENDFECIATVELLEKRIQIQKTNNKCKYVTGYICGDATKDSTKELVFQEMHLWKKKHKIKELDVLIATPPCQGMSVANHKKNNEIVRNSLVVESIKMTKEIKPKFFVYENVSAFLKTTCTDIDGQERQIGEAIELNLGGEYHISSEIINFKYYGNPSSRTRTVVIGVRKDQKDTTPYAFFPKKQPEKTLKQAIGHLKSLNEMYEYDKKDFYHSFRAYTPHMRDWIREIKEGESAFDNEALNKRPHKVVDGEIVFNAQKNGDKYTRNSWLKSAPCIHTRNDILSSQNTIHPKDDRVFSIRELMILMSIPDSFQWIDIPLKTLNKLSQEEKISISKKYEMNIRHSIGEAVPTIIFSQIAKKISDYLNISITDKIIEKIIENLNSLDEIKVYIKENPLGLNYQQLMKIAELSNAKRLEHAAFYTTQDIAFNLIKNLPSFSNKKSIRILEPSVGVGNFIPLLFFKYKYNEEVILDVCDINNESLQILEIILSKMDIPKNFTINLINADFLTYNFEKKYDLIIGNPPFKKIELDKKLLSEYKSQMSNKETTNIFSFFIEKSLKMTSYLSFITPKSLISTPEFNKTRDLLSSYEVEKIVDFGEKGFKGVKIETIGFIVKTTHVENYIVRVESYITNDIKYYENNYIFSDYFPYWLLYRNKFFDSVASKMTFNVFESFRDRQITKANTKPEGKYRVLKARNLESCSIKNIDGYDVYVDEPKSFVVSKYMNMKNAIIVPNLTYYPRAAMLPKNSITDGSIAILLPKEDIKITKKNLTYFSSSEFEKFYRIARNFGTRSLNIDKNSVFFWGLNN